MIALLGETRQADGSPMELRLLRCALFTSGKTLLGLRFEIDWLASDSRDVIQGAECVRRDGNWVQIRDLSNPFAADA